MNDMICSSASKARIINVNLKQPEKNGPCIICKFNNFHLEKFLYNGYILQIQDINNHLITAMEEECVQAHLVSPNEVFVKMPATCYLYLHDIAEEAKGKETTRFDDVVFRNATEMTRTAITANSNCHFSYVCYVFPKALDNDVFIQHLCLFSKTLRSLH